jgi:hypothetical protein
MELNLHKFSEKNVGRMLGNVGKNVGMLGIMLGCNEMLEIIRQKNAFYRIIRNSGMVLPNT